MEWDITTHKDDLIFTMLKEDKDTKSMHTVWFYVLKSQKYVTHIIALKVRKWLEESTKGPSGAIFCLFLSEHLIHECVHFVKIHQAKHLCTFL